MQLFGIPNCNTVQNARDWLTAHHIEFEFLDFKKGVVNEALLTEWLKQQPWETLVNRAGMTWRNLAEDEKSLVIDANAALNLMLQKTSVIKRPVLVNDGRILNLGFTEATYRALFDVK